MPVIRPIPAVRYSVSGDISTQIAPPYDVLEQRDKDALLQVNPSNIVAIDLPHLPPKTAGPDSAYEQARVTFRSWLASGTLHRQAKPALFVYRQRFGDPRSSQDLQRRGLVANIALTAPGEAQSSGTILLHEQTFSGPKEDRLKLMRATGCQLSPIFGLVEDPDQEMGPPLERIIDAAPPSQFGTTDDQVLHELWPVTDPNDTHQLIEVLNGQDLTIADGHHRFETALNYRRELIAQGRDLPAGHPANFCMFVVVSMKDPGMLVLPTHRILGNMSGFSVEAFRLAASGRLNFTPFPDTDLQALEAALPRSGPHAMGLYDPATPQAPLWVISCKEADPLATICSQRSPAWRQLDVAICQHLIVEAICEPAFCPNQTSVRWGFAHHLEQVKQNAERPEFQMGLILQPMTLEAISLICHYGELMPQKSTFFYPKLATGLVLNPLDQSVLG